MTEHDQSDDRTDRVVSLEREQAIRDRVKEVFEDDTLSGWDKIEKIHLMDLPTEADALLEDDDADVPCPLPHLSGYDPMHEEVVFCPFCGGGVEATETPTQLRCLNSGKEFYVEL